MRPNNPNKRVRGRHRSKGGGGGGNPLSRSYESNGPDVKIRGSALQVADKYAQLARDAQSSGDRVMAENYFQHAEHYYRIVAAAYEQNGQQQPRERREGERRFDEGAPWGEQPSINGFDGVDDEDEGLRRTLKVNGSHARSEGERGSDDDDERSNPREPAEARKRETVNGANGHAGEASEPKAAAGEPENSEPASNLQADEVTANEAAPPAEDEPKPRRRRTTTRTRTPRAKRSEPAGETATPAAADPASD